MRQIVSIALALPLLTAPLVHDGQAPRRGTVHEVQVVAKQYAFEPAVIEVTAGEPVRLEIRSVDRVHGFAIRDLHIDVQVPRSGTVSVEFTAPPAGRYPIACSEFCGSGHGQMKAALVSVPAPSQSN